MKGHARGDADFQSLSHPVVEPGSRAGIISLIGDIPTFRSGQQVRGTGGTDVFAPVTIGRAPPAGKGAGRAFRRPRRRGRAEPDLPRAPGAAVLAGFQDRPPRRGRSATVAGPHRQPLPGYGFAGLRGRRGRAGGSGTLARSRGAGRPCRRLRIAKPDMTYSRFRARQGAIRAGRGVQNPQASSRAASCRRSSTCGAKERQTSSRNASCESRISTTCTLSNSVRLA